MKSDFSSTVFKLRAVLVVLVVILTMSYHFYPRSLQTIIGTDDVSAGEINIASIQATVFRQESTTEQGYQETSTWEDITDEPIVDMLLSVLSDQKVRRRISRAAVTSRVKPGGQPRVSISMLLTKTNTNETVSIIIHPDQKTIQVDSVNYVIYGEGIDTVGLAEKLRDGRGGHWRNIWWAFSGVPGGR